jgi:hypothetical protein
MYGGTAGRMLVYATCFMERLTLKLLFETRQVPRKCTLLCRSNHGPTMFNRYKIVTVKFKFLYLCRGSVSVKASPWE